MIQLIIKGLERFSKISKVHDPAGILTYGTADVDLDSKRMPVQTGALVTVWNVGKPMSGLDLENTEYVHGRIVTPMGNLRNCLTGLEAGFRM